MSSENPVGDYAEIRRVERLRGRREQFLGALKEICNDQTNPYTYQQITGYDDVDKSDWIEFRFLPLKKGESLPEYEFHGFVEKLTEELASDEHYITWYSHPNIGQVIKVEIDES
jgi:hypothetical protein